MPAPRAAELPPADQGPGQQLCRPLARPCWARRQPGARGVGLQLCCRLHATAERCLYISCPCLAVKQDLLLAFVDCVERNGAKLARQRLQLEVLPSMSAPAGFPGSIIDVPALPQPVDVTAAAAPSSSSGGSSSSSSSGGGSSKEGGSAAPAATASNIVPKEPGSSSSKEGGGGHGGGALGGGSSKSVTVTVASTGAGTAQQELAAQAAAATAAAVLKDPAALTKIAAAISPDDIIVGSGAPQQGGINVLASFDEVPQR